MVFFENTKRLALEFLAFKKYKQLNKVLAVFVGLFMAPWMLVFAFMLAWTFLSAIFFTVIEAPIKFLHNLIKDETKEHHLAFRMLIYYLSWPIIFIFYVFYALMIVDIYVMYIFTQAFGYVASLGGFHFHITPLQERIDKDVDFERKHNKAALIHVIVAAVLLFIGALLALIGGILLGVSSDPTAGTVLLAIGVAFISLPFALEVPYAVLAYRDWKKPEEVKPEAIAEVEQPKE